MRWTMVSLCLLMAACGNQNLNSPTSPTSALTVAAVSRDAAGAGQTQARSGTELPFQGSFARRTQAVFEPPNTLVISGTEAGAATYLGQFTAVSEDRVNTMNSTSTGTYNFTAANGDELWTRTAGGENEFVPPNVSKVSLTATITGGTGRFAAATGSLTIRFTETIDFATSSATAVGSIEGQLNLNR